MILLVEDHADTAALMVRLLKHCGYDATAVATGAAALKWVQGTRPSVIVLDLILPDMTGFDVIAIVRRMPGLTDVPIVVVTGDGSDHATRWARQLGANEVVVKGSVVPSLLCDVIARYAGTPGEPG
jgi:CheY-like chemotaxis protein